MKHLLGPTDSTTLNNDAVQPMGPYRPVLEILGMVTEVDLNSNDSLFDLKIDRPVVSVEVPKHGEPGEGSVFVEFLQLSAATAACNNLHNRVFDDQTIKCHVTSINQCSLLLHGRPEQEAM